MGWDNEEEIGLGAMVVLASVGYIKCHSICLGPS